MTSRHIVRTAMVAATAGCAAIALASPASAGSFNRHLSVGCPGTSQDCPTKQGLNVSTNGPLFFTFTADPNPPACAPGKARMFIDGAEWGSAVVQPGQNDGGYYADVSPGGHLVEVQMDGVLGGCNTGAMSGWSGTLNVQTNEDAKNGAS